MFIERTTDRVNGDSIVVLSLAVSCIFVKSSVTQDIKKIFYEIYYFIIIYINFIHFMTKWRIDKLIINY